MTTTSNDSRQYGADNQVQIIAPFPSADSSNGLLIAHYSLSNHRYSTTTANGQLTPGSTNHDGQVSSQQRPARRRSSFKDRIARAFSLKPGHLSRDLPASCYGLLASLLGLNVFMSILNTVLLAFLVKSLGLSGGGGTDQSQLSLFAGRLTWDAHLEGMTLDVAASIARDKFLSVGGIESHVRDSALVIGGPADHERAGERREDSAGRKGSAAAPPKILISTGEQRGASYMALTDAAHTVPVELVTDVLLVGGGRPSSEPSGGSSATTGDEREAPDLGVATRRLLELDARRQAADLPLLARLELSPAAGSLRVKDVFGCSAGISGTLDANLDVQTRAGNVSCRSGRALRLVSRSGKLNLAPGRLLVLDAPTLALSAPATKRLLMSGIEFVPSVEQQGQRQRAHKEARRPPTGGDEQSRQLQEPPRAERLHSYTLVLVDGSLMAASD